MLGKSKKFKIILSAMISFSVLATFNNSYQVVSVNVEQKKREKSKLQSESEALRKDLIETQKNIDSEKKNSDELDGKVKEVQAKIDASNEYINSLRSQIIDIENHIKEIEKDIEEKTELLKEALVLMYKAGDASTLDIILGSKDFNDFLEKTDIVKSVGDTVGEIINSLNEKNAELGVEKANIDNIKKQEEQENLNLEASRNELQVLLDKSQETLLGYVSSEQLTKEQISKNEAEIAAADAEIRRYYEEQRRREQEELRRKKKANSSGKAVVSSRIDNGGSKVVNQGGYAWPVPGYGHISSNFYDTQGRRSMHGAIDIAGGGRSIYGASVVACGAGTVIKVTHSNSGYGNNIVIDHGDGKSSRYSHLSSIAVVEGQKVSRGQHIGNVGSTGFSTGPHLDFTFMVNGVKQDPLRYVSS